MKDTSNNNVKNKVKLNKNVVLLMYENILQINHLDINGITNIEQVNKISEELFYLIINNLE